MAESILLMLVSAFYFMLPAYFANMAPVIVKKIGLFKFPIDFGKKLNNKSIFGKNKTFRGLIFGVLFAVIISFIQYFLYLNNIFNDLSYVDYSSWLQFGLLMGFGAILGDLAESFVKRRINYEPGKSFFPFDQIDFVIGALLLSSFIVDLSLIVIMVIIVLSLILDIIVNHIAYYTGVRDEKW